MSRLALGIAVFISATVAVSGASLAQTKSAGGLTGHDKLHQQMRVGSKICMTEHEHGGEGTLASKKGAAAAAIRHWESFTAWEYGKPWGRYSLAAGQKMDCKAAGAGWVCSTRARPCRTAGR